LADADNFFNSRPELQQELLGHIWALPLQVRHYLAASWRHRLRVKWTEELSEELQAVQKLQQELHALHESSYEVLLRKARVIGCTTTGAALHKSLLTNQAVAPRSVQTVASEIPCSSQQCDSCNESRFSCCCHAICCLFCSFTWVSQLPQRTFLQSGSLWFPVHSVACWQPVDLAGQCSMVDDNACLMPDQRLAGNQCPSRDVVSLCAT